MNKTEAKKVASIVANVLVWVFLVFAALVTVLTFVSLNAKDGLPSVFGKSFVSVQSPSMDGDREGSFKQGDMLIVDKISEDEAFELEVGTIIVYFAPGIDINGDGVEGNDLNTHRIINKEPRGTMMVYETQGDAEDKPDGYYLDHTAVLAVYDGHSKLSGIGAVADFLKSSLGFFLIVVLPMALFFLYEVYNLIKIIMEQKMKKVSASVSQETEEEIKRRAIEEFLAQQAQAQASATATEEVATEEVTTEEVAEPTSSDEE